MENNRHDRMNPALGAPCNLTNDSDLFDYLNKGGLWEYATRIRNIIHSREIELELQAFDECMFVSRPGVLETRRILTKVGIAIANLRDE